MSGFLQGAVDEAPIVPKDVDLGGGFVVHTNWLSPKQRDDVVNAGTEVGRRGRLDVHRKKYAHAWCRRVIKGWDGLTRDIFFKRLKMYIVPEQRARIDKVFEDHGGLLPYSHEDAVKLYCNAVPDLFAEPLRQALNEMDEDDQAFDEQVDSKSA